VIRFLTTFLLFIFITNCSFDKHSGFWTKDKKVKLQPEMINLLGCTKENFLKLLILMNYKYEEKNKEIFFQYKPFRKKVFEKLKKVNKDDNPFNILNNVNFN